MSRHRRSAPRDQCGFGDGSAEQPSGRLGSDRIKHHATPELSCGEKPDRIVRAIGSHDVDVQVHARMYPEHVWQLSFEQSVITGEHPAEDVSEICATVGAERGEIFDMLERGEDNLEGPGGGGMSEGNHGLVSLYQALTVKRFHGFMTDGASIRRRDFRLTSWNRGNEGECVDLPV
ncbi:MAG: hypothetical protein QOJ47_532, partial [Gaiellales bacterium]|nr:hypothetical protein [Gaiellales bacterium]